MVYDGQMTAKQKEIPKIAALFTHYAHRFIAYLMPFIDAIENP
jgi:hypothetical protein